MMPHSLILMDTPIAKSEQAKITDRLDEFELNMSFPYIPGFETFLKDVKAHGVKCAVVTSSNLQKMEHGV